ncbi:MAG: DMT family transporter [Cyclobacteriaceae bacterium]|nr:DMT family transporter [Cyclobacteriaceae bacterium]
MNPSSRSIAYLLALLATLIWSGNFIVARGLNTTFTPISISFFRWFVACIAIIPFAYPFIKRDFGYLLAQRKLMMIISFLGITMFNTMIYLAAHSTSALNLSLLAITAPFYVVILNRLIFKERLNRQQNIGFLVLALGLIILITKGDIHALLNLDLNQGDLIMAAGAGIFGTYSVLVKKKNPQIGNLSFVAATFILGTLMLLPFFLGELILLKPVTKFSNQSLLQILFIGIGPSVISYYLWNRAIVTIGSTKAATIYNTLPVFSAAFAAFLLGEGILAVQVISSIIIISGVLLVILGGKQKVRT